LIRLLTGKIQSSSTTTLSFPSYRRDPELAISLITVSIFSVFSRDPEPFSFRKELKCLLTSGDSCRSERRR